MSDDRSVERESADYRVRFDECAPDGTARTAAYLRWAQDLAWLHSERLGYDRAWYEARSMTWLVRGISLEIERPSEAGERVTLTTRLTGFRRVWARRRTEIAAADGTSLGRILTDWVMTDGRGLPARVPEEFLARWTVPPGSFEPVRVALPPVPPEADRGELIVRRHEVDPLGHANNASYLDWVEDAVAALPGAPTGGPRRTLLEYLSPARPGERLTVATWSLGDGRIACRIDGADGAGLEGEPADAAAADAGASSRSRSERLRAIVEPIG